jgi:hypothetical protein
METLLKALLPWLADSDNIRLSSSPARLPFRKEDERDYPGFSCVQTEFYALFDESVPSQGMSALKRIVVQKPGVIHSIPFDTVRHLCRC